MNYCVSINVQKDLILMSWYVLLLLSFGPGLFWLWYFYQRDRWEPEPKWLVFRTFIFGMGAVIPAGVIEWIAIEYVHGISPAINVIFVAPVVEELAKFYSVRYSVYRHHEFNETMDGIVYAASAALGFASFENLSYVLSAYLLHEAGTDEAYQTGSVIGVSATRALLSVPGHVIFSAMWGYALGVTKCTPWTRRKKAYIRTGILLSIVLHSVFNLLLSVPLAVIFIFIYMLYAWKMVNLRIRTALLNSPFQDDTTPPVEPPELPDKHL